MDLKSILKQEKSNLSSFYLISGYREKNKKDVMEFLKDEISFQIKGNPDFFLFEGEKFLIEKAREIKKINSMSQSFNGYRVFILSFDNIGDDIQNTLLKVLEEPAEKTFFFFLVSNLNNILETIKSRARIIEVVSEKISSEAEEYFKASFLEREKIVLKLEKEKIQLFFNSLDLILLENRDRLIEFESFYKDFLSLKKFVGNKGVSYKHIFDYLNIYLPQG